jgi:hypothetical protein
MTLQLCLRTCGHGIWDAPQRMLDFSQKFRCDNLTWSFLFLLESQSRSTWLLPFLALVSQLPFGGDTPVSAVIFPFVI